LPETAWGRQSLTKVIALRFSGSGSALHRDCRAVERDLREGAGNLAVPRKSFVHIRLGLSATPLPSCLSALAGVAQPVGRDIPGAAGFVRIPEFFVADRRQNGQGSEKPPQENGSTAAGARTVV
jgi:hypothetical protein